MLQVRDLTCAYDGQVVLQEIWLAAYPGQVLALVAQEFDEVHFDFRKSLLKDLELFRRKHPSGDFPPLQHPEGHPVVEKGLKCCSLAG